MSPTTIEDYLEECPYELNRGGISFYMEASITVTPEKQTYNVGDTITYRMALSDQMYDQNRQATFEVKNFPFNPAFQPFRVDVADSTWYSALADNKVIIDSVYLPSFRNQAPYRPIVLFGSTTYEEGQYLFEFKLVLLTPGRYISMWRDGTEDIRSFEWAEPFFDNITNDSGCPEPHIYSIVNIYKGDTRIEEFADEFRFLDEEVFFDRLSPSDQSGIAFTILNRGIMPIEWYGMFGFEVVE